MKHFINQIHLSNLWSLYNAACNATFLSNPTFLSILLTLIAAKISFLYLINMQRKKAANSVSILFFSIPIVVYIVGEITWIISLLDNGTITKIIWRIAWHMQPLQFYTQALFLHSLIVQKYSVGWYERLILKLLALFSLLPIVTLVIPDNSYGLLANMFFESFFFVGTAKRAFIKFSGFAFLLTNMIIVWRKVSGSTIIPYFLRLQLRSFFILLSISLIPEIILASANVIPFLNPLYDNMLLTLMSSVLFIVPPLFFARRIYYLRFLNLTERVVAGPTSRLTDDELLGIKHELCSAKTLFELPFVHAKFFDKLVGIATERVVFYLHKKDASTATNTIAQTIEQFMQEKPERTAQFLIEDSILVYDEIAFTHFYTQSENMAEILLFMEQLNATVFITLRQKDRFFGALIITKDAQKGELFSQSVQTQMQLYGTFVTYALNDFEHKSHELLLEKHNALLTEMYKIHQKNVLFYEAITPLLKQDSKKGDGILFYKNSLFTSLNTRVEELLQIDPNKHQGHPLCKALKELVRRVVQYGNPHMIIEKNVSGLDICCQGFSNKNNEVVILLSLANITHTLSLENALQSFADIDYTIFLHATPSGNVINCMFPGGGSIIQKAKIQILKTLLSKKAILLAVQEDDINLLISVAKKVCYKSTVHTLDLAKNADHDSVATLLFGQRRFIKDEIIVEHGLLYTFDESGIIHIANAQFLDQRIQHLLLHFLKTGSFCLYKSTQQCHSNTTIILSSSDDLELFVRKGLFLQELYDYLKDAIITLPDVVMLPRAEFESLTQSLQKQCVLAGEYHHLIEFSKEEFESLCIHRPVSYHALQRTINTLVNKKMNKLGVAAETKQHNCISETTNDEILLQAARLGKKTLKDRKLMRELWEKFKNQSKIAQLLDVDKSSVHRRLKEYGIVKVGSISG